MNPIDLNVIHGKEYRVLSGADLGAEMRKLLKLDSIDTNEDQIVTFSIPSTVFSINSSFFSGLFQKSIKALGEDAFRKKYIFQCNDIIRKNIENGIFYIVHTLDLLGDKK